MADIATTDVTYTPVAAFYANGRRQVSGAVGPRFEQMIDVVFGNNTLLYPTGGVPLTKAGLQMPTIVEEIRVVDQGTNAAGFKIEPVVSGTAGTAPKLRFMVEDTVGTNTPLKEHTNATFVPNPATIRLLVVGY
jgi:hypothetical protein